MISMPNEFHATSKVTESHSQMISTTLTMRHLGNEIWTTMTPKYRPPKYRRVRLDEGLSQTDTMYRQNKSSLQEQNS